MLREENKKDILKIMKQFVKFGIVGVSNSVIMLLTYYIFLHVGANHFTSNTAGFALSVLNAYIWNSAWVFRYSGNERKKTITKFFSIYIFTFLLSTLLLYIFVDVCHISNKLAPIINIIITTPINFILNRLWTFKE